MNKYAKSIGFCRRFFQTSICDLKGHSKWQNIKHIKAANDLQRNLLISKQVKMIRLAIQEGGGSTNPAINTTLKTAIEEALKRDVPKGTIQTVLKRASESKGKDETKRYLFEYRLYKKLFVIVAVYTHSLAHVRIQMATPMKKHLAEVLNAKRSFIERGVLNAIATTDAEHFEDNCLTDAVECGADDIEVFDAAKRQVIFFCDPIELPKVKQKLTSVGYRIEYSECEFFPNIPLVSLTETEMADYKHFKERLLSIEGFDEVYDNLLDEDNA